jgi:hypothetical protein
VKYYISVLIALFSLSIYADDYFQNCSVNLENPDYIFLKEYIERNDVKAHLCQRLNNTEFLYTAGEGYSIKFYYCKSESGSLTCKDGSYSHYPSLSIEKRFYGKNGKQFVLFKASQLRHGSYNEGYHLFHLVPKTDAASGYVLYPLNGVGASNGLDSDAGKICSNMGNSVAVHPSQPYYEIINNDSGLAIKFNQELTFCETPKVSASEIIEFSWVKNRFRLIKNERIYK